MKKLILLPNLLHESSSWTFTPPAIDALICESEKGGWRFLKRFGLPQVPLYLLNEQTLKPEKLCDLPHDTVGLISDAGLACLADPGAAVVAAARSRSILVEAVPGPCSITLALQLSGLNGQTFMFHGYFPREGIEEKVRTLKPHMAHIFIETPYRTAKVFEILLKALHPQDKLSLALELMSPEQRVETHAVKEWKGKRAPGKERGVFVIEKKG
jgi:16S rRNA (cytidine1402-2'-O)-methyltransferase